MEACEAGSSRDFSALPGPEEIDPDGIEPVMERLRAQDAGGYDPAGFAYVSALLARAARLEGQAAERLRLRACDRLRAILTGLHHDARIACGEADTLVATVPSLRGRLDDLLNRYAFRAVGRLAARTRAARPGPLAALLEVFEVAGEPSAPAGTAGVAAHAQQQELDLVSSHPAASRRPELRAARAYREASLRQGAQDLLTRAVAESPPESGPLNPQMLATQALARINALSPACGVRYVSYLQALFYLDSLPGDTSPGATGGD